MERVLCRGWCVRADTGLGCVVRECEQDGAAYLLFNCLPSL